MAMDTNTSFHHYTYNKKSAEPAAFHPDNKHRQALSTLNRKTSSPHYVSADRAYSSRVESVTISSPQNWRFCCPGNPKIHVSYIMLHTFYRMHDTNIRFLSHKT